MNTNIRHYINLLSEKVTLNPDGTVPPTQTVNGVTMNAPTTTDRVKPTPIPAAATATANPWEGKDPAKAEAWAKLTPEDQKWLGGADPTDKFILYRAPKKGAPAPVAAPVAAPAAPVQSPEQLAAAQTANGVDPATGQNVTMPDGTNPETGQKTTVTTPPAAPANRDAMTFGQAFADARKAGEKQFNWKGKPYSTELAKPAQGGMAAAPVNVAPAGQPPSTAARPELGTKKGATQAIPTTPTPPGNPGGAGKNATLDTAEIAAAKEALKDPKLGAKDRAYYTDMLARQPKAPVKESTGYDEVDRLVSLVHYR